MRSPALGVTLWEVEGRRDQPLPRQGWGHHGTFHCSSVAPCALRQHHPLPASPILILFLPIAESHQDRGVLGDTRHWAETHPQLIAPVGPTIPTAAHKVTKSRAGCGWLRVGGRPSPPGAPRRQLGKVWGAPRRRGEQEGWPSPRSPAPAPCPHPLPARRLHQTSWSGRAEREGGSGRESQRQRRGRGHAGHCHLPGPAPGGHPGQLLLGLGGARGRCAPA